MPFFDAVPDRPKDPAPSKDAAAPEERQESSLRRWLGLFALPVSGMISLIAAHGPRTGNNDSKEYFIMWGVAAGALCIVLSKPRQRALKWVWLVVYPFVALPLGGLIDFMVNGLDRLW
jgi:hypothetical protein